jgi:LUD domain
MTRTETLLARIRAALGGHAGAGGPGFGSEPVFPDPADRVSRFRERFEDAGGIFLEGPSPDSVLPVLGETLRTAGVVALTFPGNDGQAIRMSEALVPLGPFRIASPEELRRPDPPVTAGIQTAEFAIGETGTIVQTSRGGTTLLPGLLTDVHVALLSPGIVCAGMEECLRTLSADLPRNISLITGPSRTADIELTLTIGVHGPRGVIAVLLP